MSETDHTVVERRLLDEALTPGAVALDAGCGRTTRLRDYRDRIIRLVGLDGDEAAGRENPFLDEFVVADLDERLPFDDASFDLVYANFVVEHLGKPEHAFTEWRRILRPGGHLVLLTSNRANPLMALADRFPQTVRLAIKRRGAGAAERDVYPTRYLVNTPQRLARVAADAGFRPVSVNYVATLHRYGARLPPLAWLLRVVERALPPTRRSTIVASYR
ncbi:MAG TPA: methyltransferase domain-containing protein [Gaiellaceae bacterium]|nr:methyltransferase domain-containing protein [Gaiellaceae bacterium]